MHSQDIIKGIKAVEELIRGVETLKTDAVLFIIEKDMHEEFMKYHMDQEIERLSKKEKTE